MDKDKGDTYNISGQAGAAGPNAHAHDNTFNQIVNEENFEVNQQVQGNRNVVIGGNVSGSTIITGDNNKNEK
jgi:hypothetical protein